MERRCVCSGVQAWSRQGGSPGVQANRCRCRCRCGGMICEELPPVGSSNLGSWDLVNMSCGDSTNSLKIFVIEGGDRGKHQVVALYESSTRAWCEQCKLPAAMLSYVPSNSFYRLSSVVLGHLLYIFALAVAA
ncbi:hypothetical protein KC19_11G168200 [Ceratodon purpureus]|uniref:Uncharacterized protein n=1 Tax=Ceratodon purpureus TaxID=3225 RepID=A0A8T0GI41_CERPU|nr:hypothetical protein KC19_11G168200 [Ceratodon purpureus]